MVLLGRGWLPCNLLLLALIDTVTSDALDFSLYPTNSQSCLYAAAASSACDHSTVAKFNTCVCGNGGGFLDSAATCLGTNDKDEVSSVFNTMSTNCGDSNTPIAFSAAEWAAAAAGSSSSSAAEASSSTAKSVTYIQTTDQVITAPTGSTQILTITQSLSAGQTSAAVTVITLEPGQTTRFPSVITVTTTPTGTAAAQSTTASASSSTIGAAPIAGIVIGGVAIFAVAGLALFFLLRRRRDRRESRPEAAPFMGLGAGAGVDESKNYIRMQSYTNLPPTQGTEADKFAFQQQPQQYPPTMAYDPYHPQPYGPLSYTGQQPYGDGYAIPQNGAVELSGRPGVPNQTHELPTN